MPRQAHFPVYLLCPALQKFAFGVPKERADLAGEISVPLPGGTSVLWAAKST
jgi:hypothetical protein